jgi:hypothetical protein
MRDHAAQLLGHVLLPSTDALKHRAQEHPLVLLRARTRSAKTSRRGRGSAGARASSSGCSLPWRSGPSGSSEGSAAWLEERMSRAIMLPAVCVSVRAPAPENKGEGTATHCNVASQWPWRASTGRVGCAVSSSHSLTSCRANLRRRPPRPRAADAPAAPQGQPPDGACARAAGQRRS